MLCFLVSNWLSTFLNTKSQHSNPQIVRTRLTNYLQMLSVTRSSVSLNVAIRSVKCVFCGEWANFGVGGMVTLQCCQGKVCGSNCFRRYVYTATGSTLSNLENIECPMQKLHWQVTVYFLLHRVGIYTTSQATQRQADTRVVTSVVFTCGIHMDERVRLICSHAVCGGTYRSQAGWREVGFKLSDKWLLAVIPKSLVRQLTPKLFRRYTALTFESAKSDLLFNLSRQDLLLYNVWGCIEGKAWWAQVISKGTTSFNCRRLKFWTHWVSNSHFGFGSGYLPFTPFSTGY